MHKTVILVAGLMFLASSFARAADFYLLEINSSDALSHVRNIVSRAHGTIDNRFIVELDENQAADLCEGNISAELVAENVSIDRLYLVSKIHPDVPEISFPVSPFFSTDNQYLLELDRSAVKLLKQEGYMIKAVTDYETPLFYRAPVFSAPGRLDYPSDTIADLISRDSLYTYDTCLENFQTRFILADSIHSARDWMMQKFIDFGYDNVQSQLFYVTDPGEGIYNLPCYNVICIKEGTEQPDKYVVIGAHYDSYNYYGPSENTVYAPGADDDASGVAGVLELARVFSSIDTRKSIVFIPFSAEEVGLYGSEHCAERFYNSGTDIELMINFDMIGYQGDTILEVDLAYSCPMLYCQVFEQASGRVADLIPITMHFAYCDAESFGNYGYDNISPIEAEFNPSVHSDYDVSDSMDFEYMEEIVRATAASMAIICSAPDPISCQLTDFGDGQSVRVSWDDCHSEFTYKIVFGTEIDNLSDTADVSPPDCYHDLAGLIEGTEYFAAVLGFTPDGYHSLAFEVSSITPLIVPRTPVGVTAEPDLNSIIVSWQANTELDMDHYCLSRKRVGGSWETLVDFCLDTSVIDFDVISGEQYMYVVQAIDGDGYVSDSSALVTSFPATFDQGILMVEETQSGGINPSTAMQNTFYNNVMNGYAFDQETIDSADEALTRSQAGRYNPIFYIDDDDMLHHLGNSLDTLKWYTGYNTDLFLAGWETIIAVTGQTYCYEGNFFHDELGLSFIGKCVVADFVGGTGEGDWPDLVLKPEAPYGGHLPDIEIFSQVDGAEVIARFDSYSGNPFYDGRPVGIAYDTYDGKRVVLGCPLYWLTEASAQALIQRVMEYFAAPSVYVNGDVNDDRIVNLLDITYLIAYLYQGGPPPVRINHGDPNGDCTINILDVVYLINYLYNADPAPVAGCVE